MRALPGNEHVGRSATLIERVADFRSFNAEAARAAAQLATAHEARIANLIAYLPAVTDTAVHDRLTAQLHELIGATP